MMAANAPRVDRAPFGVMDDGTAVERITLRADVKMHFWVDARSGFLAGAQQQKKPVPVRPAKVIVPDLDQSYQLDRQDGALALDGSRRLGPTRSEEAKRGWDWHNELSALSLELRRELDALADDKARMVLLKDVRRVLEKR